jgi:hypothetical protein
MFVAELDAAVVAVPLLAGVIQVAVQLAEGDQGGRFSVRIVQLAVAAQGTLRDGDRCAVAARLLQHVSEVRQHHRRPGKVAGGIEPGETPFQLGDRVAVVARSVQRHIRQHQSEVVAQDGLGVRIAVGHREAGPDDPRPVQPVPPRDVEGDEADREPQDGPGRHVRRTGGLADQRHQHGPLPVQPGQCRGQIARRRQPGPVRRARVEPGSSAGDGVRQFAGVPGNGCAKVDHAGQGCRLIRWGNPVHGSLAGIGPEQVVESVAARTGCFEQVQIAELFEQDARAALWQIEQPRRQVDGELVDLGDPEPVEDLGGLQLHRVRTALQLPHRQRETGPYAVVGAAQLIQPMAFVGE